MQIFRAGTHTDSRGRTLTFSAADIEATAAAYAPDVHEAPLVVGHPALDDPAYGWVESLAATDGGVLEATPTQVDPAFAEMVAEGRFKRVSASFYAPDAHANPVPGVWYLRHVGFLGAHPPAVKGLRPVMFAAAGAVDGLVTIEFSAPTTREDTVPPTPDPAAEALATLAKERAALDETRKQLDAERERLDAERAQFAEAAAAAAAAKRREDAGKIVDAAVGAGLELPRFRGHPNVGVFGVHDGKEAGTVCAGVSPADD